MPTRREVLRALALAPVAAGGCASAGPAKRDDARSSAAPAAPPRPADPADLGALQAIRAFPLRGDEEPALVFRAATSRRGEGGR